MTLKCRKKLAFRAEHAASMIRRAVLSRLALITARLASLGHLAIFALDFNSARTAVSRGTRNADCVILVRFFPRNAHRAARLSSLGYGARNTFDASSAIYVAARARLAPFFAFYDALDVADEAGGA